MRPTLVILLLALIISCHQDVIHNDQLYGKWLLAGGSALVKRQAKVNPRPIYFVFATHGSIESNWSNCYSFRFGAANELLITNGCVDCAVVGCDQSVWHYSFSAPDKLMIEFGPDDTGLLQRE